MHVRAVVGVSATFEFVSNGDFSSVSVSGRALVIYARYYFR